MYKYSGKDKSCFLPFSWRFMTFAVLVLILSRTGAINAIKSYNNKLLLNDKWHLFANKCHLSLIVKKRSDCSRNRSQEI